MRFAISVTFCIAYGRRIENLGDDFVVANQGIERTFLKFAMPGQLVDSFPFLLHLPRPLQWFRYEVDRQRKYATSVYTDALNTVKKQIAQDTAQKSMATLALQKQREFEMDDHEIAYALSAPWSAGVLTTVATIEVAILAMLHDPSVMRKAQAEIDRVVGRGRIPDFSDIDALPYLQALIKETLRWRPIAPIGFAHCVTEDDVYNGMFIPKGSTVFANISAITSDPKLFPEPEQFKPERFLNTDDPRLTNYTLSFGFGRRVCPGLHIAQQSVFIVLVRMLWAFDMLPALDSDGKPDIPPSDDFTSGI
ncbi:hypothetical protein V5O48_004024, partial [Marasmius crinis-equi]